MTFKKPLSIKPTSSLIPSIKTELDLNKVCKICGDKAFTNNYGALSCSSCKAFFRRNGFRSNNPCQCDFNGNCEITILTRKICTACRLAKCFAVGMNSELIRKEDLSQIKSTSQPPVLNLLSNDQSSLSKSDWILISNIIHAFDTYTPIPNIQRLIEHSNIQFDLEQSMHSMSKIYLSTESIISSTPDFRIMTIEEQRSLIERNMHGLWAFNSTFTFRESGLFNNTYNEKIIIPLYGISNVQRTKHLALQLDYDLTIIKLMLITLIFSSNCFTVVENKNLLQDNLLYGTFRLFGSQNVYAELMWNYMIYRYGFDESVKRYSILIKILLDIINLASEINENNTTHHQLADEIIKQTERSLILNNHENVSLWGKNLVM